MAKGYTQKAGIDFKETFSPVVKHDSLRVILTLVAVLDLVMMQLDVKTAFYLWRQHRRVIHVSAAWFRHTRGRDPHLSPKK